MNQEGRAARLPPELILQVLDVVVPGDRARVAYRSKDIVTRTLIAFTQVSRLTYAPARKHLFESCAYIDLNDRLRLLLYGDGTNSADTRPSSLLPKVNVFSHITAMFLQPYGETLDDLPTAMWIRELFYSCCDTLRRLVIDCPLRSLYPENDHLGVRKTLREAFCQLQSLEDFVSVRDELYLSTQPHLTEPPVWLLWPRLKRLALYNVDGSDEAFWGPIADSSIEVVVLSRPDLSEDTELKQIYLERSKRPIKVVFVDVGEFHQGLKRLPTRDWKSQDPTRIISVWKYDVPMSYYGDENVIELCQDWAKQHAISGSIWSWEGELLE